MTELDELLAALKIWMDDRYYRESDDVYNASRAFKAATPPLVLEGVDKQDGTIEQGYIYYDGQCYKLPEVE